MTRLSVDTATPGRSHRAPLAYNLIPGARESWTRFPTSAVTPADGITSFRVRKSDVLHALIEQGSLVGEQEREKFRQFCRLLGAIFHYDYYDQLERLRDDYFYFNPELDGHVRFDAATIERAYQDMIDALMRVLRGANFIEVPHEEIESSHREHAIVRVNIETPMDDYREVRFFRRGRHSETIEISEWYGWRKRSFEADVYDDIVLLVTMKNANDAEATGKKKRDRARCAPARCCSNISTTSPAPISTRCSRMSAW